MPENLRPVIGTSNAEELIFSKQRLGLYRQRGQLRRARDGRQQPNALHASEVAFWNDLDVQMASLMQTVPDLPGTEIILESTANGYNAFHALWSKAIKGESRSFYPSSSRGGLTHSIRRQSQRTGLQTLKNVS